MMPGTCWTSEQSFKTEMRGRHLLNLYKWIRSYQCDHINVIILIWLILLYKCSMSVTLASVLNDYSKGQQVPSGIISYHHNHILHHINWYHINMNIFESHQFALIADFDWHDWLRELKLLMMIISLPLIFWPILKIWGQHWRLIDLLRAGKNLDVSLCKRFR